MNSEALQRLTSLDRFAGVSKPYQEKLESSAKAKGEVEAAEKTMQVQRESDLAAGEAGVQDVYAKGFREIPGRERKAEVSKQLETPFIPTKETAGDMAQLFALINIAGFAMGAGGKRNAQAAMSAMNGMMEGYQKGRMDLYKKEKEAFETNVKRLKTLYDTLDKEINDAMQTLQTDRQAGLAKLKMAYAKTGADFYKNMEEKRGVAAMYEHHKAAKQEIDKVIERVTRDEERARAQAFRESQARESSFFRRQSLGMQQQMLQLRMDQAAKSAEAKGNKPPAKELLAQNTLRNTLIPKLEQAIPVLDRLNKEGKWSEMTIALGVDPRGAEKLFENDPEALNLILTLAYFRSKEFETAGKALTKKEDQILAPIVRSDFRSYAGLRNALSSGLSTLKQEQKALESASPYIRDFNKSLRGETDDQSGKSQYSIGQVIERGNKKYRVTGLSDPNNPDIEEVK